MSENRPRWISEIPKPILTGKKRELKKEEKKEAKEFENAVRNGNIDKWFSKKN